jgi:hypothetical protein
MSKAEVCKVMLKKTTVMLSHGLREALWARLLVLDVPARLLEQGRCWSPLLLAFLGCWFHFGSTP